MASTVFSGTNYGAQVANNSGSITNHFHSRTYTVDDIDLLCLRTLRCPDALVVKNRLKENKDKLLYKSIEWIFQDPQYSSWQDGDDVCLLWIKGGAGKGKTMMSIGLIERISVSQDGSTVITYFFCQNADYELNTIEAIIKGLILQLVNQQKELKESLRSRWDTVNERFNEDVSSWRSLWNIFLEMLDRCKCSRVYVIVDALDECQDEGMADLLKLIVRTGFSHPSKIKWLLTSRPLDSAERELLAGSDLVQVGLELNSKHVSEAVETYIAHKVAELDRCHSYGQTLRRKVETELTKKAEGTFLWVSLVCKRLENVGPDKALATIQDLPPGLHPFYHQIFNQLSKGELAVVKRCMRLLKAMMLAYRPLNVGEAGSVTGLPNEEADIEALVDRCASFLKMRGTDIDFVHQSARDYLAGENGQSILDSYERYGHGEIALSCLSYLSGRLKINLVDLPRPDSTREAMEALKDNKRKALLDRVNYAATFWAQHLEDAKRTMIMQNSLAEQGEVGVFLRIKLLEWLECLSLLDKLPRAIEALKILANATDSKREPFLSMLVQDATRFLLRHYQILMTWPLQIYSSAIVFSPQSSIVRRDNLDKLPTWLRRIPRMEDTWASLIQTLAGHSESVSAVAFSPDGKQIASGSHDGTIKLWDTTIGNLQKTLAGHSSYVVAVAFSPDGGQIASGSYDGTIKLWDTTTGDLQKTLAGCSGSVYAIAFSPDGKQIVSGLFCRTIELWDTTTGNLQKTLAGHSEKVNAVAFSPDGKQIASGSDDKTIKLWDTTTGNLYKTLAGHSGWVYTVAFSPDGKQIASGSYGHPIKLWDTTTGNLQKTLVGHSKSVSALAFSSDGKQIASASGKEILSPDQTIKVWDTTTGNLQRTLAGHSQRVSAVAFSPDGKQIASGSDDKTLKIWDVTIGNLQKTLAGHSSWVTAVAFSPDGKHIASGSDNDVMLWDTTTGDLQKTLLVGDSGGVTAVAFAPDGKQIASGNFTIELWDTTTGNLQKTLAGRSGRVYAIAFSPDGMQIVSASADKTIKIWDTTTGNLQKTLAGHSDKVNAVTFSPDGKQIVSGADNTIKLWDVAKSPKALTLLGRTFGSHLKFRAWHGIETSEPIYTVKFSADGRYVTTNLGSIKVESILADSQSPDFEALDDLCVKNQWIYYGGTRVFRLPSDFQPQCYDVRGNQVTIGLRHGRVLSFDIDCRSLHSELQSKLI